METTRPGEPKDCIKDRLLRVPVGVLELDVVVAAPAGYHSQTPAAGVELKAMALLATPATAAAALELFKLLFVDSKELTLLFCS